MQSNSFRAASLWVLVLATSLSATKLRAELDWGAFYWHNDAFLNVDGGGYTNGAFFSFYDISSQGGDYDTPWLLRPLLGRLIRDTDNQWEMTGHTLGQMMVTPKDIKIADPDPNSAPYAGLLFLRSSYLAVHEDYADQLSLTLGILGPSSGAEEVQKFVHKLVGANEPQGWDHQLKDEPVAQLSRSRVWRFAGEDTGSAQTDLLVLGEVAGGNLESGVGSAVIARYGQGLKQSFATAAQMTERMPNPIALDQGWHVYGGITGGYLYNQIFVNGNTFRDSPEADLRHWQHSFVGGASYSWQDWSLSLSYFQGSSLDKKGEARERYGSVSVAWRL